MAGLNKNPDLIEPVALVVETINKVQTPYSTGVSGKREIINHVVRDQFTIPAQVVFANLDQDMQTSQLGASEKAKGYVILKRGDLKAQGKQINRGDRIVQIHGEPLKQLLYFIHSVGDLSSHFSDTGFSFVRVFFSDREPVG